MTINAVSSNTSFQVDNIRQSSPPPAHAEVRGEKENDGDSDDSVSSNVNTIKPTVNTNGQSIGTIINVTA